ncbi:MAG: hypothetical protein AB7R69_03910 [Candidatus Babeliales bacterium]
MDKNQQSDRLKDFFYNPAHLWLGPENVIVEHTERYLQKLFCAQKGCGSCFVCKQILERQFPYMLWVNPEKNYTLEQLEPIFKTASFALEQDKHFVFVIQKADFFNQSCANALLKIMEEPPKGYHFILLAERSEYIVPTIKSRCIIQQIETFKADNLIHHEIVHWFKNLSLPDASTYQQALEQKNISERETLELLDILLQHWETVYAQEHTNQKQQMKAQEIIALLQRSLEKPPMPGSSKLFWKNLYLLFMQR